MNRLLLAAFVAACSAATPPDLVQSYYLSPSGRAAPLHTGTTYHASLFPVGLRVTVPAAGWFGVQWKSGSDYFRGGAAPNYGWVHLGRGPTDATPRGLISIMTAYTRTPSVAAVVNVLRTRGRGATYDPSSPVTVGGFSGEQFDGRITGGHNVDHIGHFFIPFSPPSHAAKYYADEYPVYGDVFRVLVLNVRGRTVVVYIENAALPAEQFPAFLTDAERLLASLEFPAAKGA